MNTLLSQVAAAKEAGILKDQTEDVGGFEREPPAAGKCVARFISYIEVGEYAQKPYQGKPKPPAMEAFLEFELLGKKHAREIEIDGEKKTIYPIQREKLAVKAGDKASFVKLMKSMAYGRDFTHIAEMLGEGFIIDIVHNEVEKEGKKTVYANMKDDTGAWRIGAPVQVDAEGDTISVKVPETTRQLRLLLWDAPSIEQWNSVKIEGSWTKKVDGKPDEEVSKNKFQDLARGALDFEGSPLQIMLAETSGDLPELEVTPVATKKGGKAAKQPVELADEVQTAVKAIKEEAELIEEVADEVTEEVDPLAALGL